MAEQTPHDDDPIRRLRENYTERLRIDERRDRIETYGLGRLEIRPHETALA